MPLLDVFQESIVGALEWSEVTAGVKKLQATRSYKLPSKLQRPHLLTGHELLHKSRLKIAIFFQIEFSMQLFVSYVAEFNESYSLN